jgi:hypothetical protein
MHKPLLTRGKIYAYNESRLINPLGENKTMAQNFSMTNYRKLQKRAVSLQASTKRARENAGQVVNHVVRTGEVAGTAFGLGVVQGRTGGMAFFGVPLELGLGVGAHAFALLGVGRGAETHLAAVGDGALAAYFGTMGRGVGKTMKGGAVSGSKQAGRGLPPRSQEMQGEALTEEDLAELATY